MSALRRTLVVVLVVGLIASAGASSVLADGAAVGTTPDAPESTTAASTATVAPDANNSSVNVTVGQQLTTIIGATEADVQTEVAETTVEVAFATGNESRKAEALAERAEELREQARDIRTAYREATRDFENGEITKSEYSQRIAVLNARARNVVASYDRLEGRAANVSAFELATAGLNRTALRNAVAGLDSVTGPGASALLLRFTGQREGEVELERDAGLSIEVEGDDGERSLEVERPRDDDDDLSVAQSAALSTARSALSEQNGTWTLTSSSVHPVSGYYRFRFTLSTNGTTGEAEVRVDGSTGEVFRLEEEIEPRDDDAEADEVDEEDSDEEARTELALVVAEGTPAPNATVTVKALAGGQPLANATVLLDGAPVGTTGSNGTLTVRLPEGSSTLVVRSGGEDAELEFEFDREDDERDREEVYQSIDTTASYDDGTVSLSVSHNGSPVENVVVYANDERVGRTAADGTVTFTTDATEDIELDLVKGELEAELAYRLRNGTLVLEQRAREGDGDHVAEFEDLELSVVDGEPARGATVTVRLVGDGEPVADATVRVDGEQVGRTDADGELAVTLPNATEVTVSATVGGERADLEFEFETEDEDETETEDDDETETEEETETEDDDETETEDDDETETEEETETEDDDETETEDDDETESETETETETETEDDD